MPEDHFRDVGKELDRSRGVFAGSAAWDNQEQLEERISSTLGNNGKPIGFDFKAVCNNCGKGVLVTLPWIELITASEGLIPADADTGQPWVYSNGFLYPPITCSCGRPVPIPVTPDKANRYLQTAISMQIFPAQAVIAKKQEVQALAQQGRRR